MSGTADGLLDHRFLIILLIIYIHFFFIILIIVILLLLLDSQILFNLSNFCSELLSKEIFHLRVKVVFETEIDS